jgi:transposase-like protein
MIVALGITADGTKRALGPRQGATENAAVCVALLEDSQARGLDTSQTVLLVLDGAKVPARVREPVWAQNAVIQRCQVHKKRNAKDHDPERHRAELERRLSGAYHETAYGAANASLEATARWVEHGSTRMGPRACGTEWGRRWRWSGWARRGRCVGRWPRPIPSSRPSR